MSEVKVIDKSIFEKELQTEGFIVLDFWAEWCPPCKFMMPIFEGLAKDQDLSDIRFLKINADEQAELVQAFEVTALPTFVIIKSLGFGQFEKVESLIGGQDGLTFKNKLLSLV
jgi:thioredoxin 1